MQEPEEGQEPIDQQPAQPDVVETPEEKAAREEAEKAAREAEEGDDASVE